MASTFILFICNGNTLNVKPYLDSETRTTTTKALTNFMADTVELTLTNNIFQSDIPLSAGDFSGECLRWFEWSELDSPAAVSVGGGGSSFVRASRA